MTDIRRPGLDGLRLVLVDLVPQLVDAWRDAILDVGLDRVAVEVVEGSLLDAGTDAIVAPGDSFGSMDGGVDLAVVDAVGEHLRERVQRAIEDHARGELVVGRALVVPLDARPRWLVVAPTMRVPMRLPPGSVNPYLAMRAALDAVRHGTVTTLSGDEVPAAEAVTSLAVPGLGTGTGRMGPELAARQMVAAIAEVAHGPGRPPQGRWEQRVAEHRALARGERAPSMAAPRGPAGVTASMSQPPPTLASHARGTTQAPPGVDRDRGMGMHMQQATAPPSGHELAGRFASAVAYAATAHGEQVRKGTALPYVSHLLSVAALVLESAGTEPQAVAGVLHDVVEDCGGVTRLDDVRATFGDEVADMVSDLSDAAPASGEAKAPWRRRKQAYLAHLDELVARGAPAVLVSCCDKLHNAESIVADATDPDGVPGLAVFDRFSAAPADTAWYYGQLLERFRADDRLPPRLVARFDRAVAELTRLALRAAGTGHG